MGKFQRRYDIGMKRRTEAASNGQAPPPDAGELHRLVDRLPHSQLSRAQLLLQALLGDKPY